jgi:AbrB family looped-hinge helix DNA binding protein
MNTRIVAVTRKGQATIPKEMREKHGVGRRVLVVDLEEGILLKAAPTPSKEQGSLKTLFGKKSARQILAESRVEDRQSEKELLERRTRHSKKA